MKIERIAMAAALVSALAASACPQSDKSTPEGTVKSFQTARRAFEDANLFYQIQETLNKVEEPYITDPLKEKRKVALAKTKEYIAEKQNYKTDSCESAKNEDGSVSVVIKDSYEQKGTDPASGKQETKPDRKRSSS